MIKKAKFEMDVIEKEIDNSLHHLDNAVKCYSSGMYDLAIVSSYTSMFHSSRTLLFMEGYRERSHICLISFLRQKYPELEELTNSMDIFRSSRHTMLYGIDPMIMKEDADTGIERAKDFILCVRKYVYKVNHT